MKSANKSERLTVRIEKKTIDELTELAKLDRREFADYVRMKLEEIILIEKEKAKKK